MSGRTGPFEGQLVQQKTKRQMDAKIIHTSNCEALKYSTSPKSRISKPLLFRRNRNSSDSLELQFWNVRKDYSLSSIDT